MKRCLGCCIRDPHNAYFPNLSFLDCNVCYVTNVTKQFVTCVMVRGDIKNLMAENPKKSPQKNSQLSFSISLVLGHKNPEKIRRR